MEQKSLPSGWPPLDAYMADPKLLGHEFSYPAEYLDCIAWAHEDIDLGGDGHALTFLTADEIQRDLISFVRTTTSRRLIPFARGGNGDELYCFDEGDAKIIFVINLGEKRPQAKIIGRSGFSDFINNYRCDHDLPPWGARARGRE